MPTSVEKPLEFFHPDPTNPRKHFDEGDLRQLGESLLKRQLVPGIAREDGMMIDMHRRWMAATLVGKKTLDAYLLPMDVTPAQVKEIQLITRLHSADLIPYEVFLGSVEWLKLHPGANAKALASAIDRSEAYVSSILSLLRCVHPVRDAAAAGKIGLSDWRAISKVPANEQEALLAAKLGGASRDELESRGRKLRNGHKEAVRVSRLKCQLPKGCVTLAAEGVGLTLDDVIEILSDLLKEAKKANDQGLDSKTFSAVLHDKAKGR
jgi:ParB/RepB/Spo0J family partition protein